MKCHSIFEAVNKGPSPFMKAGPERSPPASGNNAIHAVGDTKVQNKRLTNAPASLRGRRWDQPRSAVTTVASERVRNGVPRRAETTQFTQWATQKCKTNA